MVSRVAGWLGDAHALAGRIWFCFFNLFAVEYLHGHWKRRWCAGLAQAARRKDLSGVPNEPSRGEGRKQQGRTAVAMPNLP